MSSSGEDYVFASNTSQCITSAATNSVNSHSVEPTLYEKEGHPDILDNTEGSAAFADLIETIQSFQQEWREERDSGDGGSNDKGVFRILDLGGGQYDHNTHYLQFQIPDCTMMVMDPYQRSKEHNQSVHNTIIDGVNVVTSMSVLNILPSVDDIERHLKQVRGYMSQTGTTMAFFKVWAGLWPERGSNEPHIDTERGSYQSNAYASVFLPHIERIFNNDDDSHSGDYRYDLSCDNDKNLITVKRQCTGAYPAGDADHHNTITISYSTGNSHYSRMEYEQAITAYSSGIHLAQQMGYYEQSGHYKKREGEGETDLEKKCVSLKLCLNRAQCYLKVREYMLVERDCTKVISASVGVLRSMEGGDKDDKERDAVLSLYTNYLIKALYRRALSYEYIGDYSKGLQDCDDILSYITLDISAAISKECSLLRSRLVLLQLKDDSCKKTEQAPSSFITPAQTLRLNFIEGVPSQVYVGQKWEVRLCIGNEFGLWNRANMQSSGNDGDESAVYIKVEVLSMEDTLDAGCAVGNGCEVVFASPSSQPLQASGKCDFPIKFTHVEGDERDERGICVSLRFSLSDALPNGKEVLPIYTLPICITQGAHRALSGSGNHDTNGHDERWMRESRALNASCIRDVSISHSNTTANVSASSINCYALECPGTLGIGGKLWDSTFVLLDMLHHHCDSDHRPYASFVAGKNILELGSGTGLGGIGLCGLGPLTVTLSDFPAVVPLLEANIILNNKMTRGGFRETLEERYSAMPLIWGEESDGSDGNDWSQLDTIIACDCVYDPVGYAPLVRTLYMLLTASTSREKESVALLVHRHRHPEDSKFFKMLEGTHPSEWGASSIEKEEGTSNDGSAGEEGERRRVFTMVERETGVQGGAVLGDVRFLEIRLNRE